MTADDRTIDDVTEGVTIVGVSQEDFEKIIRAIVYATHDTCAEKIPPQGAIGLMMLAAMTVVFTFSDLSREEAFALADSALAMAKQAFSGDDPRNRTVN